MLNFIRKNIGIVFSFLGFFLLVVLTFGNIVDVFTFAYWVNVYGNLLSIGMLSISLIFIQTMIKQGISEQALSKGLNTDATKSKYIEHKAYMKKCEERLIYLPYFLDVRNLRETNRRKKEFLINNRFTSEKNLLISKNKKLIKKYNAISTNLRLKDIKWSSTEVVIDKYGRIETLPQFRHRRLIRGIATGFFTMLFTTLVARELFSGVDDIPLWAKFLKLVTYIVTIAATVLMGILRNYEKGAFGVPNDLDEINAIWCEFYKWSVPQTVIDDVEKSNRMNDMAIIEIGCTDDGAGNKEIFHNQESTQEKEIRETLPKTIDEKEEVETVNEKAESDINAATDLQEKQTD